MARRPGGDPYGQDDFTNDNGVTPDPYGTVRQPVGTQPAAGTTPQPGPSTGTNPNPYANSAPPPGGTPPGGTPPPASPTGINPQTGFAYGSAEDNAFYGPSGAAETRNGMDPAYVKSRVYYLSTLPGANPSLTSDPDYWVKRIIDTGGWKSDGTTEVDPYWKGRALQPEGPPEDASTSQTSPFLDTFRNGLLDRLKQLQQPTDPNSDAIRLPTDAYNLSSDRGLEATKRNQAQAAYAGHSLNTGGYQQVQTQADEQNAADKANFTGNLVSSAEQQRQSRLDALLGLGSGQGTTEELAGGQLGYAYSALKAQRDRDAILAALGTYGG